MQREAATGDPITVDGDLRTDQVVAVARDGRSAQLADAARARIAAGRAVVDRVVAEAQPAYGITTGFGGLSDRAIPPDQTAR